MREDLKVVSQAVEDYLDNYTEDNTSSLASLFDIFNSYEDVNPDEASEVLDQDLESLGVESVDERLVQLVTLQLISERVGAEISRLKTELGLNDKSELQ